MIRVGAVLHCMPSVTCFTPTAIKRRKFGALESTTEQHDLWLPCCTDWHNQIEPTCSGRNSVVLSAPSVAACCKTVKTHFWLLHYLIPFSLSLRVL